MALPLAILQILTLNVWALPDLPISDLSPRRVERIQGLCGRLRAESQKPQGWKIILLQEAWVLSDRQLLSRCGYPYSADAEDSAKMVDSGLMVLSQYPIVTASVQKRVYRSKGQALRAFSDGEWFAQKGALFAKVLHPRSGPLWIVNTHLISNYQEGTPEELQDRYLADRTEQLEQLALWTREIAGDGLTVVGGDLNFGPRSPLWPKLQNLFPQYAVEAQHPGCTYFPGGPAPGSGFARSSYMDCQYDHTLASQHLSHLSTDVIDTGFSDHAGVETRWMVPAREANPSLTGSLWDAAGQLQKHVSLDQNPC